MLAGSGVAATSAGANAYDALANTGWYPMSLRNPVLPVAVPDPKTVTSNSNDVCARSENPWTLPFIVNGVEKIPMLFDPGGGSVNGAV